MTPVDGPFRRFAIASLKAVGLFDGVQALKRRAFCLGRDNFFLRTRLGPSERIRLMAADDPVRYGAILLAVDRIRAERIDGSFAEVGVYRGLTSRFIHSLAPERRYFLFDTFEGFPKEDLEEGRDDDRFTDTNLETVRRTIGNLDNVVFKMGYFPDTATDLENENFAFVMLDADLYNPTLEGLKFFYPRVSRGGYLILHDYNSPESDWAVSRATDEFMKDKPEKIVEIPDSYGSIIIRKS